MAQRLKTDWTLFFTILAMVCFGMVMVYSSSSTVAEIKFRVSDKYFVLKQLWWGAISFVLLLWCKRSDYRRWNTPKAAFAGIGIVLLLLLVDARMATRTGGCTQACFPYSLRSSPNRRSRCSLRHLFRSALGP